MTEAEMVKPVDVENRFKRMAVKVLKPPGGDSHGIFGDINEDERPVTHCRILKPPGGASSDIFGTNAGSGQEGGGRRNNYNKSNMFEEASATPAEQASENRRQAGNGTIGSIFGGPDLQPYQQQTPRKVKDYMKSSVFGTEATRKEDQLNGNHTVLITDKKTDEGHQESASSENSTDSANPTGSSKQGGGNPITGEGYNAESKEDSSFLPAVKVRNPPGGHSTKLW